MKVIYVIETNPIVKEYFSDVHWGYINTVNNIEDTRQFNSYEDAQIHLDYIVTSDFECKGTLYLSIVKFNIFNLSVF